MKICVLGGGITGRLLKFLVPSVDVYDWTLPSPDGMTVPKLTRQFGANYLWKPIDGIACVQFDVVTHIDGDPATRESVRAYKEKVGKAREVDGAHACDAVMLKQFPLRMVGYDFAEQVPADVWYGYRAVEVNPVTKRIVWAHGELTSYDILVNTIPLPAFLALLKDSEVGRHLTNRLGRYLSSSPIYVRVAPRPPDAPLRSEILYVNYLSDPQIKAYRYCDRFGERHYEGLADMGPLPTKRLVPGKINDLPEYSYRELEQMLAAVQIYNFGRYARWRSDELVHETVDDLKIWRQTL